MALILVKDWSHTIRTHATAVIADFRGGRLTPEAGVLRPSTPLPRPVYSRLPLPRVARRARPVAHPARRGAAGVVAADPPGLRVIPPKPAAFNPSSTNRRRGHPAGRAPTLTIRWSFQASPRGGIGHEQDAELDSLVAAALPAARRWGLSRIGPGNNAKPSNSPDSQGMGRSHHFRSNSSLSHRR